MKGAEPREWLREDPGHHQVDIYPKVQELPSLVMALVGTSSITA